MNKKEMLKTVKNALTEGGCELIEITHFNGKKSGIANPKAIQVAMEALLAELDRQIAECED